MSNNNNKDSISSHEEYDNESRPMAVAITRSSSRIGRDSNDDDDLPYFLNSNTTHDVYYDTMNNNNVDDERFQLGRRMGGGVEQEDDNYEEVDDDDYDDELTNDPYPNPTMTTTTPAQQQHHPLGGVGNNTTNNTNHVMMVDFDDPRIASLPRILLMGPRRAGKTSIQRVVFHKMSPHETLFRLEATQMLEQAVVDHTPLCRFTIWDFPGEFYDMVGNNGSSSHNNNSLGTYELFSGGGAKGYHDVEEDDDDDKEGENGNYEGIVERNTSSSPTVVRKNISTTTTPTNNDDLIFSKATALIFVLDAQDEPYDHVLQSFTDTVTRAIKSNPAIAIEVFVHKVDGELFLSDEAKYDCRRDVMQQVADELADAGLSHDAVPISYHLTSIYDHSVFEAFSRVVQRLIPESPTLENLLNVLVSTCSMEKAYLFDVASKLYISTDSSPVDMQSVELCSDMIDVVLDVSGIYGMGGRRATTTAAAAVSSTTADHNGGKKLGYEPTGKTSTSFPSFDDDNGYANNDTDDDDDGIVQRPVMNEIDNNNYDRGIGEMNGVIVNDRIDNNDGDDDDELLGKLVGNSPHSETYDDDDEDDDDDDEDDVYEDDNMADAASSAYDSESSSAIRLKNGMVLYLKEVDTMLALVCLTRAENFRKKSLIDYNIGCLKRALMALPQSAAAATTSTTPNTTTAPPRAK